MEEKYIYKFEIAIENLKNKEDEKDKSKQKYKVNYDSLISKLESMREDIVKWLIIKEGYYKEMSTFNTKEISGNMLPSNEKILEKMFNTVLEHNEKGFDEKEKNEEMKNNCLKKLDSFLGNKTELNGS